jgi:hypothetical protein
VVKGHPLAWHTVCAPWLLDLSTDEIADVQDARIRREVADFAGVIDTWDVINEVVIMPVFDKEPNGLTRLAWERGRIPTIRLAFDAARQTNPTATLLLNDFDMSTAYECLIEGVLEAGWLSTVALVMTTGGGSGFACRRSASTTAIPFCVGNQSRPSAARMPAGCPPPLHSGFNMPSRMPYGTDRTRAVRPAATSSSSRRATR